jgi:Holliday junction resolvase RusA-like endonuclease
MSNKSSLRWKESDLPDNLKARVVGDKLFRPAKNVTQPVSGKIIIDLPPYPSPRMVRSDKWKKRPVVVKYFQWRKDFVLLCKQQGYTLQDTFIVTFVIEMPRSWSKYQKRIMDGKPHKQRPDVDNLGKSCLDAWGIEDGFVYKLNAEKYWGIKGAIIISR